MIQTVSIVGFGALGVMYGHRFVEKLGKESVRIVVNKERRERYEREGVYCNGQKCEFRYTDETEKENPADLVIFAVKFGALDSAIATAKNQIGPDTVILSVMNGITSEEIIGDVYGKEKMLYCTVQGMDVVKEKNQVSYVHIGTVTFGERDDSRTEKTAAVEEFLKRVEIPYEIPDNMMARLWAKLMLNDGVNQSAAVFETGYGGLQTEGEPRRIMLGAMKEVQKAAEAEGILMEPDIIEKWMKLLATLNPEGEPSLRQDTKAGRKTDVELFGGTIRKLGRKHGIETPYNDFLYEKIREIEAGYDK